MSEMACNFTVRVARWAIPVGYAVAFVLYPFVGEKRALFYAGKVACRGIRIVTTVA